MSGDRDRELALEALDLLATSRADNREDWLHVGMGLHSVSPDLLDAWDNWSQTSDKYEHKECAKQWRSFKVSGGIGLGTLIRLAREDSGDHEFGRGGGDGSHPEDGLDHAIAGMAGHLRMSEVTRWPYSDEKGAVVFWIVRFEAEGREKEMRPFTRGSNGWQCKAMDAPRPLYRLLEVLGSNGLVYVCEGEKAADSLRHLGLIATTSSGGSNAPSKSDWMPLAGRNVVILPDRDAGGESYLQRVQELLQHLEQAPRVRALRLPDLPDKGDAVEFVGGRRAKGDDNDTIRSEIELLLGDPIKAGASAAQAPSAYQPFPTAMLPPVLAETVEVCSKAIGCDPAFLALPLLASVAAAIGNAIEMEVKGGWVEPSVIWAVIVGYSGTAKSPALDKALGPMRALEQESAREFADDCVAFEAEGLVYSKRLSKWKRGTDDDAPPPEKPIEPKATRYLCADVTIEALAPLLHEQPHGLLLARDELAGWLLSFDQYKGGGGGDVPQWLEVHGARSITIDRKTGNIRTILVPRAAVSVTGGIQPEVLRKALGSEHFHNGLAARLLLACPPRTPRRWSDAEIPEEVEDRLKDLFRNLVAVEPGRDAEDQPKPVRIKLSPEAKELFVAFFNKTGEEQCNLDGAGAAAWSKLEGYAARFALVLHVVDQVCSEGNSGLVTGETMGKAIRLVEWFKAETLRVYGMFSETDEERQVREWVERIGGRGGRVSVRDWQRMRSLSKAEEAKQELQRVVDAGAAKWWRSPKRTGAPSEGIELLRPDRTPPVEPEAGVLSEGEATGKCEGEAKGMEERSSSSDKFPPGEHEEGVLSGPGGTVFHRTGQEGSEVPPLRDSGFREASDRTPRGASATRVLSDSSVFRVLGDAGEVRGGEAQLVAAGAWEGPESVLAVPQPSDRTPAGERGQEVLSCGPPVPVQEDEVRQGAGPGAISGRLRLCTRCGRKRRGLTGGEWLCRRCAALEVSCG